MKRWVLWFGSSVNRETFGSDDEGLSLAAKAMTAKRVSGSFLGARVFKHGHRGDPSTEPPDILSWGFLPPLGADLSLW